METKLGRKRREGREQKPSEINDLIKGLLEGRSESE